MKHDPESEEIHDKLDECIQDAAELLAKLKGEEVLLPPIKKEGLKRQYVQGLQPIVHRMQLGMSQILEFLTSAAIQDTSFVSEETTQQLCQIALLDHPAIFQIADAVSVDHRRKAVRHHDRGPPFRQCA